MKRSTIPWVCKDCKAEFESKNKLYKHRHLVHHIQLRDTSKICSRCKQHYDGKRREHNKVCPAIRHDHKHTEETKRHLSEVRKKWLKEHPESHPWKRKEKFKSVPCEKLKELLRKDFEFFEEYTDKRWEHNYSIDIAFLNKKIAIEVNGNQHYNYDGTLKEYYQKRHTYLESLGWLVFEIHYANCFKESEIEKIKHAINTRTSISVEEHQILFQNRVKTKIEREIEKLYKINKAKSEGKLDKTGKKIVANKLSYTEWDRRKNLILNSGIDLMKFGWVGKVIQKTGLTIREVERTIKHFQKDFEGKYFKRKYHS